MTGLFWEGKEAAEYDAEGRAFDLIERVNQLVVGLSVPHTKLKLAHDFAHLYLQHHVLRLRFGEPILYLNYFVSVFEGHLVHQKEPFLQICDRVEHQFASQQIANLTLCLNAIFFASN